MASIVHHAPEADRVRANTWPDVNTRLDREAAERLRTAAESADFAGKQLERLGREWDVDRAIEAEASATALAGLALAVNVDKRFLAIPVFVAAMLLLYSQRGWYPLLPLLRRLGFRTADEIERERYALKALRGDFDALPEGGADVCRRAKAAWDAVCK